VPRAQSYCERAIQIDESLYEVWLSLGNLHLATGKFELAEAEFLRAIEIEPGSSRAYRRLGRVYADWNRENEAEEALLSAIELAPNEADGHNALANFYFKSGRLAEAISHYEKAIKLAPDEADHYLDLGSTKYLSGDFAGAEAAWRKSLAFNANQPTLLFNMGTAFFFEKRFNDALEMYLRSSEFRPDDPLVWSGIADAYRFIGGKETESIAAYDKAIVLAERMYLVNANDVEVTVALARFYATTNQPEKAEQFLDISLRIGRENMYMWYDRSLTYVALGRIDDAIAAVEQLVGKGYSTDILASDVMFTEIANDPRFKAIIGSSDKTR